MSAFDEYLGGLPEPERAELERLRRIVHELVPGVEEATSYGMPAFRYRERPLLGFRAGKTHLIRALRTAGSTNSARPGWRSLTARWLGQVPATCCGQRRFGALSEGIRWNKNI